MGPVADDVCVFSRPLWLRLTALAGLRLVDSGPSSLWYQRCGAPPEAAMWIPAEAPGLCASVCLYGPMDGGVCPPCRQGACPRGFVRPESPTYPGCGPPLLPASADGGGMAAHDGGLPPSSYGGGGGGVIGGGAGDSGFSDGGGSASGSTAL